MTVRRPAEIFPPGEILREELEARGWTQGDLAEILGRPPRLVNEIIAGKRGVSPETARGLAAAFGTSPEFWMNLEVAYQVWRVRRSDDEAVAHRARLYSFAPIKEMLRRGWIESSASIEVLERRILGFFEVGSLDETPVFALPHAARTSQTGPLTMAQQAWLFRAKQLAQAVFTQEFNERNLDGALERLRLLLHEPLEARHVPRILSDAGIRFVVVEPLPSTRIDGACFWLDAQSPVIALSLRYDRIDNFWHTLMHELAHVKNKDDSLDTDLEQKVTEDNRPEFERVADMFAVEQLIPRQQLAGFIARVRPIYSSRRIEAFARTVHVHAGIVVGQLQHQGEILWSNFRRMLVPIRDEITTVALTDGWGVAVPAKL